MTETWRCFVAIEPAPEVCALLTTVQQELRAAAPSADVRWSTPGAWHVTLAFFGAIGPAVASEIGARLARCTAGVAPLELAVGGVGAFPDQRRPRVIWMAVAGRDAERLRSCTTCVRTEANALGLPLDETAFAPHVTLGRVRRLRGVAELRHALVRPTPSIAWRVERLVLFRSHLAAAGSRYEILATAAFAG